VQARSRQYVFQCRLAVILPPSKRNPKRDDAGGARPAANFVTRSLWYLRADTGIMTAMSIRFECGSCGEQIKAPDESAGKRARCPHCKVVQQVPGPEAEESDDLAEAQPGPNRKQAPVGEPAYFNTLETYAGLIEILGYALAGIFVLGAIAWAAVTAIVSPLFALLMLVSGLIPAIVTAFFARVAAAFVRMAVGIGRDVRAMRGMMEGNRDKSKD
jgi:hypothetical protein